MLKEMERNEKEIEKGQKKVFDEIRLEDRKEG